MKRIIIICEGPTETEFCKDVLYSHFLKKKIIIQTPLIKKSGGGIVPWNNLKKQIENHLLQEKDSIVSTLIDYYGIKAKFEFPKWENAHKEIDKNHRMSILESGMKEAVDKSVAHRFMPYIQLHEFEGLLFNNIDAFVNHIPVEDFVNKAELEQVLVGYPNPELINNTPNNAPSYRLKRLIKGYNKIVYGSILAQEIGLKKIRSKSPRFNEWITMLENI
ncbi:protein of unknown function [Mucilaginibacter lappiensis]|uniref:DUF4276 family protein n=1 Tax=Mucilaginibacter lappiensis TaxID=354630 RepID=A0ABR6PKB9_9SPHI|nr:DUF4276 family protein [Mucilaginibacter lappiensis]MBB6110214.1 hypothetical protein [Mucilaginibacter lappiensis]SIR26458.1 protein of unknown function [Mucilaginibacter lappiensis]